MYVSDCGSRAKSRVDSIEGGVMWLTSLASDGGDERGDAEDDGGAHVDAVDEVVMLMMMR